MQFAARSECGERRISTRREFLAIVSDSFTSLLEVLDRSFWIQCVLMPNHCCMTKAGTDHSNQLIWRSAPTLRYCTTTFSCPHLQPPHILALPLTGIIPSAHPVSLRIMRVLLVDFSRSLLNSLSSANTSIEPLTPWY